VHRIKLSLLPPIFSPRGMAPGQGSEETERGIGMTRKKILVVEDNEDIRYILVARLQHMGDFDIREVATGHEALASIMQELPDVLLLDLKLPGMDGWEMVRRVRTLPAPLSQLPIMAVTAHALRGDRDKALAAGCDEYVTKPIMDFGEFQEKLERLLSVS
jgi:CheY-like chemotaxis protein